ncbi:MAG: T9SS type A sorting domain-containing protein [Ignavibacteriales bacterium]|nr:T9SS type A sorting domain-containing protein [Ignavibacteriales bacterium]
MSGVEGSRVILKIYDVLGREIKTLVNQEQTSGVYEVIWNGDNELGNKVSTGVYFYRIDAGDFVQTKKDDADQVINNVQCIIYN